MCGGVHECVWVCTGVHECGGYAQVCSGVGGSARVCAGVHGYARVCASVWDEFSEFLLENRLPTSADFNTYPIRIFIIVIYLIFSSLKAGAAFCFIYFIFVCVFISFHISK